MGAEEPYYYCEASGSITGSSLSVAPEGEAVLQAPTVRLVEGTQFQAGARARVGASVQPTQSGTTLYYLHTDHLGTPRLVTAAGSSSAAVWRNNFV